MKHPGHQHNSHKHTVNKRVGNKPSGNPSSNKGYGRTKKRPCKQCLRMRWVLTILILASMSAILYLDQFAD